MEEVCLNGKLFHLGRCCLKSSNIQILIFRSYLNVDLKSGRVSWEAIDVSVEQIKEVIEDIGFDVVCDECLCHKA